jgi:hypothetical protein
VGASTSAVLAETYLKHYGTHTCILPTNKTPITGYYRYADDILVTYDQKRTNVEQPLNEFNELYPAIKFKRGKGT